MAENKKSFILYADLLHTVELMPDDSAGKLFKHILKYVNDLNPISEDLVTQLTFEPIKQQLKRDLVKWEDKSITRSESGRLGGIKSGEARRSKLKQNEANALNVKQNEHVTVNVNVSDNVNVNDIHKPQVVLSDFDIALNNFKEMRKKMRKPLTDHALDLIKNELENLAPNNKAKQVQILNQSTMNGWLSVFELKVSKQKDLPLAGADIRGINIDNIKY